MNTFMKLDDMLTCSCTDRNDDHPPPENENENENENEKGSSPVLSVFCLSPSALCFFHPRLLYRADVLLSASHK